MSMAQVWTFEYTSGQFEDSSLTPPYVSWKSNSGCQLGGKHLFTHWANYFTGLGLFKLSDSGQEWRLSISCQLSLVGTDVKGSLF